MDGTTNSHESTRMKTVELDLADWWQIIDGLTCRAEQYELTAQYHETGFADGDILDVRDAREAKNMAVHYWEVIGKIGEQIRDV